MVRRFDVLLAKLEQSAPGQSVMLAINSRVSGAMRASRKAENFNPEIMYCNTNERTDKN